MAANLSELEQLVLLALLRLGDTAYGVSITRELADRANRVVNFATVYKALIRLETEGLVEGRLGEPTHERGGRRKRYYRLLPAGRAALAESLDAIRRMSQDLASQWADEPR
jgi:DNA-binding PadR family transcriptional regulator